MSGTVYRGERSTYELNPEEAPITGRVSLLFRARDVASGGDVLLKVFRPEAAGEQALTDFRRELKALRRLSHPHILEVLDTGTESDRYFLALPRLEGGNLRSLLHGASFVPLERAIALLRQVASAVDFAHSRGVVHGDIKPENVLLDAAQRTAWLADFGMARHFDVVERLAISTVTAVAGGTSAYLSPEQLSEGKQSRMSDVYSFGLMAHELLAGRLPFDVGAPLFQQLSARVAGQLMDPAEANPALEPRVCLALKAVLAVDPKKRPATATAFCDRLAPPKRWDLFIAHAGSDGRAARKLYDLVVEAGCKTFLDSVCILAGDDWDRELAQAQRDALITVVLVSSRTDAAYYQREEIAAAISLAREDPKTHRVVPVFLDEGSRLAPPYGLRAKHGLLASGPDGERAVVAALVDLVHRLTSIGEAGD